MRCPKFVVLIIVMMGTQVASMSVRPSASAEAPEVLDRRVRSPFVGEVVHGFTELGGKLIDHAGSAIEREHIEHIADRRYVKDQARRKEREREISDQVHRRVDLM